MYIKGARLGFATNSSSTHSIVLDPAIDAFGAADGELGYGWQDFLLRDEPAKAHYLASQLHENLRRHVPASYARAIAASTLPAGAAAPAYIDHQSVVVLPSAFGRDAGISLEFFADLTRRVMDPRVGIAGGNDNDDSPVHYGGRREPAIAQLARDGDPAHLVCRKDGEHWVLFDRRSGAKVRLSFATDAPYERASRPELVDVKITDFCPFGCDFCYQSSTLSGSHAGNLASLWWALGEREVFEVALGGGETTMHPHFAAILAEIAQHGMTPNFTTFTARWTRDEAVAAAVREHCGGFAVSCASYRDIPKVTEAITWADRAGFAGQVGAQAILGVLDTIEIVRLIQVLGQQPRRNGRRATVTLLGYKSFGRGAVPTARQRRAVDMPQILAAARKAYVPLGMDTAAVVEHAAALDADGVPPILRTDREGRFSMYVDAVAGTIARDSYTAESVAVGGNLADVGAAIDTHFPFA